MEPEAPNRGNRRGFRRWAWRMAMLLAALPLVAFGLSNLWLASPYGREWIAIRIKNRTSLDAEVGSASWSPWNGISLGAVDLLQPLPLRSKLEDPLLRVSLIRVRPVWQAWLHKRPEVRSIELEGPRIVLPIEILSALIGPVSPGPQPPAEEPPAIPPPDALASNPPPIMGPEEDRPPAAPAAPTPAPPAAIVLPPPPAAPPKPTTWLHINHASATIVSAGSGQTLFEVANLAGSVPLSGNPAHSSISVGSVKVFDQPLAGKLQANLDWKPPLLAVGPMELLAGDLKIILAGKIASVRGFPLQIEAALAHQPLKKTNLPAGASAEAEAIAADLRFRGLLLAPASWQANLIAEAVAPQLRLGDHQAAFDRGRAITVLRSGVISCLDARLIGDDMSILGNATVIADGRAAGVLRIVAPPETITSTIQRLFSGATQPAVITPLATPQRAAFDLHLFGSLGKLYLQLGPRGPVTQF